jgi:hypothetical protein
MPRSTTRGQNWTHEQLKLAFHLYCQLPFGKLHKANPEIVELAKLIGRTPSALAMKLVNFASLDPVIIDSGRTGLRGASAADRAIWSEFHNAWESLALECADLKERLRERLQMPARTDEDEEQFELPETFEGETRVALREYRIKQGFFRRAVLSTYNNRCCMSGLAEKRLLVASHIVPWSVDKANRLNPANGLSLSAIHDRAFDKGLITVLPDFTIGVSPALSKYKTNDVVAALFELHGRPIALPKRFRPSESLLRFHNERIFVRR